MLQHFRLFLKDKHGEGYIDVLIQFAIIMSLIFCFVSLWKPYIYKQNMDYMAKTLIRSVEANGKIDSETSALASELKATMGINPNIKWEADFISGTNKIQLRKKFKLLVTDTLTIKLFEPTFGNPIQIQIPIKKEFIGISQVYWK